MKKSAMPMRLLWRNRRGAVGVEYAFLVAFIAIVAAGGMMVMGNALQTFFQGQAAALEQQGFDPPPAPE
jgi:Flp pilus assembly pilin Flp